MNSNVYCVSWKLFEIYFLKKVTVNTKKCGGKVHLVSTSFVDFINRSRQINPRTCNFFFLFFWPPDPTHRNIQNAHSHKRLVGQLWVLWCWLCYGCCWSLLIQSTRALYIFKPTTVPHIWSTGALSKSVWDINGQDFKGQPEWGTQDWDPNPTPSPVQWGLTKKSI